MKNERAPRTLAECEWTSGYPEARIDDVPTAAWYIGGAIGAVLAVVVITLVEVLRHA